MKFTAAIISLAFICTPSKGSTLRALQTSCTNLSNGIIVNSCKFKDLKQEFEQLMAQNPSCALTLGQELKALTGAQTVQEAKAFLGDLCAGAVQAGIQGTGSSAWTDIHPDFDSTFMESYIAGGEYLNGKQARLSEENR